MESTKNYSFFLHMEMEHEWGVSRFKVYLQFSYFSTRRIDALVVRSISLILSRTMTEVGTQQKSFTVLRTSLF